MSSDQSDAVIHHYAACDDCDLYKFAESEDEAHEYAEGHEDKFTGHSPIIGTVRAEE